MEKSTRETLRRYNRSMFVGWGLIFGVAVGSTLSIGPLGGALLGAALGALIEWKRGTDKGAVKAEQF
ncbi:hypothetical protein [Austwickia chelonae]|uniref:hypothetical protein n=1 Tax=Austwickia chelonae TaxID=100225 RepID=UPI000E2575AB|nr:hypothetical protein [Austwickia chelonae]